MPRLFTFAAKSQEGLEKIMEEVKRNPTDMAAQFLLNETVMPSVSELYRGYCILNTNNEIQVIEQIKNTTANKLPIYFIFNGLNADWIENYTEMMKIEAFKQSICQQNEYLKPFGLNLIELMTMAPETIRKNVMWMLVAHTAIQLALVDCLKTVGIQADSFIGHSVGELACAYADSALTLEQTILAAYQRGNAMFNAKFPAGLMANVALTWEQAQHRCPSGVMPAYYNADKMCVISGPKTIVKKFIEELLKEGIFAEEINTNEIAFHSQQMTTIASEVKSALEKLITKPVKRSSKWISTSVQKQRWSSELAQYASADYFVHNMCSHVLFNDAIKTIPSDAVVIEVGPRSSIVDIIRKTLSNKTTIVPLITASPKETLLVRFWTQLGHLYMNGVSFNTMNLFVPKNMLKTVYPVPVNTRFLTAKYQQCKQIAHQYKEKLMNKHELMMNVQPRHLEQNIMGNECTMNTIEREYLRMYECKMEIIKKLLAAKEVTFQQNKVLQELYNLVKMGQWKATPATLEQELELVQNLYMFYPKQGKLFF